MVRDFFTGVGLLGRGLGLVLRSPRLLGLGLLPALISGLLYAAAISTLVVFIDDVAAAVTWFADDWSEGVRDVVRVVAGGAVLGLAGLLGVLTFTAVTLLIGDPFYEKISGRVEHRYGGIPDEVEVPLWQSLRRSLVDSLRLIGLSVVVGIPLFAAGFIPVVGQTVVPVIGAVVGGWLLTLELTGVPFEKRGKRLRHRREELRARRPLALGYGVAVFLCFLIPLGAVLLMPAAVAGSALLARMVFGLPTRITTVPVTPSL
ncbi:EI24 domain-containing protein [Actinoplanes sp. N902-109]|uniref:EI24 domain-containing protein n=1 Tax=Actinoplanes sp. (strain N902-109) TaxID=649831 RepID=UPI0003A8AD8F|nr:EI24 domain-containing protein [Actinoplanes sp. N902-109]